MRGRGSLVSSTSTMPTAATLKVHIQVHHRWAHLKVALSCLGNLSLNWNQSQVGRKKHQRNAINRWSEKEGLEINLYNATKWMAALSGKFPCRKFQRSLLILKVEQRRCSVQRWYYQRWVRDASLARQLVDFDNGFVLVPIESFARHVLDLAKVLFTNSFRRL